MPRSLNVDPEKRLVVVKYHGVVTDDDLMQCVASLKAANFPVEYRELADLREVTRFAASAETLRWVANHSSFFGPTSVRVILASSTEAYGIGRMVQTYAELSSSAPFLVVHTQEEAEKALGVKI